MAPNTYAAAAASLVDMPRVQSAAYRNHPAWLRTHDTDPDLLGFSRAFHAELKRRGMPFIPHRYYRGEVDQNREFDEGNSRARFGQSPHNFGMAVDVIHHAKGWNLTRSQWAVLGHIGKEVARKQNLKITWGGDWRFYDPAHWELADWKVRAAFVQPPKPGPDSFREAFRDARQRGLDRFVWQEREYTTELA